MEPAASVQEEAALTGCRHLWRHAVALLLLLLGVAAVVGTDSAFVTDESYVVIQLDTIEDTGGWIVPHPFPQVDPEGAAFPLHGASRYDDGYTLYAKHPALIYLYLPIHRAFGVAGLVVLSVVGTWLAAVLAAQLADRIRSGTGPVALWLVGVGSPLFFDAFLVHAHSIAAAVAAGAALLAVRAVDEDRPSLGAWAVVAALVCVLLRSEGALFAVALGVVLGLAGLVRRRFWLAAVGAACTATGPGALLIDRVWGASLAGTDQLSIATGAGPSASFLEARGVSLAFTMVMPGYRGGTLPETLTATGAVLLVAGAIVVRRRPDDRGALLLPIVGALLLVLRSGMTWGPIPGLLVAFCVGLVGLALLGKAVVRTTTVRLLLATSCTFTIAVAATQYATGGHTEWGGRYFALALPLIGAVSSAALVGALGTWPREAATMMRCALVAAACGLAVLAVATLRASHEQNRSRADDVLRAAAALPAADGQLPVVVTEDNQVPRLARGRFREVRFLLAPPGYVELYLSRLAAAGVDDLLLVSLDPAASLEEVPPRYEPVGAVLPYDLQYESGGGLIRLHLVDD